MPTGGEDRFFSEFKADVAFEGTFEVEFAGFGFGLLSELIHIVNIIKRNRCELLMS